MGFKRFLAAFGIGGPSVDTVLANPHVYPGGTIEGHIELQGGEVDSRIDEIALSLATRAEIEHDEGESQVQAGFARVPVTGPFHLAAGERRSIPFRYPVPWQTPLTEAGGAPLPGAVVGVRTELAVAGAIDKGDLDPLRVYPVPSQDRLLEAFARLGFQLKHTDVEQGHISGTRQEFPLFQEIEYYASPRYAHEVNELELSFIADPHGMDVVIEFDKRGGLFTSGQDVYGHFRVDHADADRIDWAAQVASWIDQALERHRGLFGGFGHQPHGHYGHDDHGGGGMGMAAGAVGGLAAGFIAAEAIDEVGDLLEGDDE
ncbi:sporulation protein [Nocardiopsis rhodophaea]|uniref:Sporulation protein n=1 Tax=Nocardiopsis rhodophaea TaxID=280238 RepID=A0ABN2S4D2_9ACTN